MCECLGGRCDGFFWTSCFVTVGSFLLYWVISTELAVSIIILSKSWSLKSYSSSKTCWLRAFSGIATANASSLEKGFSGSYSIQHFFGTVASLSGHDAVAI